MHQYVEDCLMKKHIVFQEFTECSYFILMVLVWYNNPQWQIEKHEIVQVSELDKL